MNELTVGSLFSGVGGIEIGFEKQGFKTKWFIEKEPYAQEILKKRFPSTKIYEDITQVNFREVPRVDILTGGFPCQDISTAGNKVGIKGVRSSLWRYYCHAIRILQPRIAFIENVSALTIRGLNVVLSDLAKIGYDAEWYNISASAVGAFHQRERIFIIAYPNSNGESDESFNEGEGQGFMDEFSNTSSLRRDDGSNNREERHIQDVEERSFEENKSEGNGWQHRAGEICEDVSNPKCLRSQEQGQPRRSLHKEESEDGETSRFNDDGFWRAEPELGRVAHGISNRVDRIKCLGNAVVPQCAEVFAKAIKMKLSSQNPNNESEAKDD